MTTAHRPTWKAAVGQANEGGWSAGGARSAQRSALDAPAHTTLKFRAAAALLSSNKQERLQQSLWALKNAEQQAAAVRHGRGCCPLDPAVEERGQQRLLQQTAEVDKEKLQKKYNDSDVEEEHKNDDDDNNNNSSEDESDLDAADDWNDDDDDDNNSSSSSSDDDDEAALQAELDKIRAERQEATQKIQQQEQAAENAKLEEAALLGNPLLQTTTTTSANNKEQQGRMKRRWNDDVVFRNQAKGEPVPKKRFINDTVRNDFHKRFLNKFIR